MTLDEKVNFIRIASGLLAFVSLLVGIPIVDSAASGYSTMLLATIWGFSALAGVKWRRLLGFGMTNRRPGRSNDPSWNGAFWMSYIIVAALSLVPWIDVDAHRVVDALAICLGISYIGAKWGCRLRGCCNWKQPADRLHSPRVSQITSLPGLEAYFTIALLVTLLSISTTFAPGQLFGLFCVGHFLARCYAYHRRGMASAIVRSLPGMALGAWYLVGAPMSLPVPAPDRGGTL